MTHVLLIGAGFSHNWGAPLASEVFEAIYGSRAVQEDTYLRKTMLRHQPRVAFEDALADVQADFARDPASHRAVLKRMQGAVSDTFGRINSTLIERRFEFQKSLRKQVTTFLARFDAIFSLNQDILLEHHYFRHLDLTNPAKWHGAQLPGMRRIRNQDSLDPGSWGYDQFVPLDPPQFRIHDRLQPCFKLHGSTNWRNVEGGSLMIFGGNKSRAIASHAVLQWSLDKFREYLAKSGARLMVIGYAFRDEHINDIVIDAVRAHGLRFFVVDRNGRNVVRYANPSFGGAIYAPGDLDEAFEIGLIRANSRSLSDTFGDDEYSFCELMDFFVP